MIRLFSVYFFLSRSFAVAFLLAKKSFIVSWVTKIVVSFFLGFFMKCNKRGQAPFREKVPGSLSAIVNIKGKYFMNSTNLNPLLSSINSFEEFEKFKLKLEVLEDLAKEIIHRHQLMDAPLTLFSEGTNIVFSYGDNRVIKIYPPFHRESFTSELLVLKSLQGKLSIKTPVLECHGEISGWPYIVMTKIEGTLLEGLWESLDHNNKMIIMRELGALIREVHSLPIDGLEAIDCHWDQFIDRQINNCLKQHQSTQLPEFLLEQLPHYLESIKESLPKIKKPVILTGEYTPMNFLVKVVSGVWHINGLIDFGDSMLGLPEYDLLGPGAFLIQGDKQLLRTFLMAYGYLPNELTPALTHQLTALMLLHRYSNLKIIIRIEDWENNVRSIKELENLVWGF